MTTSECPCYNCPHRYVGCHDACSKYREFKEMREEQKKKIQHLKQLDEYARRLK